MDHRPPFSSLTDVPYAGDDVPRADMPDAGDLVARADMPDAGDVVARADVPFADDVVARADVPDAGDVEPLSESVLVDSIDGDVEPLSESILVDSIDGDVVPLSVCKIRHSESVLVDSIDGDVVPLSESVVDSIDGDVVPLSDSVLVHSVDEVPDSVDEMPDIDEVVDCPCCKTFHAGGGYGEACRQARRNALRCSRCGLVHEEYNFAAQVLHEMDKFDCKFFIPVVEEFEMDGDTIKIREQVVQKLEEMASSLLD
ncbi:unnamed protein product [Urochloa humidicola]